MGEARGPRRHRARCPALHPAGVRARRPEGGFSLFCGLSKNAISLKAYQHPLEDVPPELTASIASMATFAYLDPLIYKAYRIPNLPYEQFPPLSDRDFAANLVKQSFKVCSSCKSARPPH